MKLIKWILSASLIISTACWPAVEKLDDNYLRITTADAHEFAEIAKENEKLKAELRKTERAKIYIGVHAGTDGVGGHAGVTF